MEIYNNGICGWCRVENLKKIQIGKPAQINVNGIIKCSKEIFKKLQTEGHGILPRMSTSQFTRTRTYLCT